MQKHAPACFWSRYRSTSAFGLARNSPPDCFVKPSSRVQIPLPYFLRHGAFAPCLRNWRRRRDSNPRYGFTTVQRFSKPPPSASRPRLRNTIPLAHLLKISIILSASRGQPLPPSPCASSRLNPEFRRYKASADKRPRLRNAKPLAQRLQASIVLRAPARGLFFRQVPEPCLEFLSTKRTT